MKARLPHAKIEARDIHFYIARGKFCETIQIPNFDITIRPEANTYLDEAL
jgi:hypothetical protein